MSIIKQRLAEGKKVRIFGIGAIASHKLIELVGSLGCYDGVWIDQEHAGLSQTQIEVVVLACRAARLDAYVRLTASDYATVMRPYEAGASGVMAAQVRTIAEVKQLVAWAKFPPLGVRGMNMGNWEGNWTKAPPKQLADQANAGRWIAVQIETPESLDIVDEIAATDGVDHLFVGPVDLSVTLGVPGEYNHPKCLAALKQVSQACQKHRKSWGIVPRGPEHIQFCLEHGCQLFAVASDLGALQAGFAHLHREHALLIAD